MAAHLTETTSRGSVSVVAAKQDDLDRDTTADNDLRHRITCFLSARGVPQTEVLEVKVKGGTVSVRGRLPDEHAKWLCLECCRHVAGVLKLIDDVEVESFMLEDASPDIEERLGDEPTGVLRRKAR